VSKISSGIQRRGWEKGGGREGIKEIGDLPLFVGWGQNIWSASDSNKKRTEVLQKIRLIKKEGRKREKAAIALIFSPASAH